jgi:hypothetical protein
MLFFTSPKNFSAKAENLEEAYEYCKSKGIDPVIVIAISRLESVSSSRYYPYVIRVNRDVEVEGAGIKKISRYVYDCRNKEICIAMAKALIRHRILNFDMGVFQLNYYYQRKRVKNLLERAFDIVESFKIACDIVAENVKKYGYNANAVALYHSSNYDLNRKYAWKFWKVYKKLKEKRTLP